MSEEISPEVEELRVGAGAKTSENLMVGGVAGLIAVLVRCRFLGGGYLFH